MEANSYSVCLSASEHPFASSEVAQPFFSVFVQQKIGKLSAGSFFLVVFGFCSVDDFGTVARAVTVPAHTPVVHAQAVK